MSSQTLRAKAERMLMGALEPITYATDEKGRKVRVVTENRRVTREEIKAFLTGVRGVHEDEALEAIGKEVFKAMIGGSLRPDSRNPKLFWVTAKAAEKYSLPPVKLANGAVVPLT